MDGGTLVQLRNILSRCNVVNGPSKNVTACEVLSASSGSPHSISRYAVVSNEFT